MHLEELTLLSETDWQARAAAHRQRLSPLVDRYRRWRMDGLKHPVYDFLFSYYSFSSGQLLRWTPGIGVGVELGKREEFEWPDHIRIDGDVASIDVGLFPERRLKYLNWAIRYLEDTRERPPVFHCLGLHEWAMVYKSDTRHHPTVPLRLGKREVVEVVESHNLCCTHYDAFRFFSAEAAPRNRYQLQRESVMEYDQPGCIHANMDLYKFGYKVAPFLSSELLADLFFLAKSAREIDMRASPYDLSEFGLEPICLEMKEGRERYVIEQKRVFARGQELRESLGFCYARLRRAWQNFDLSGLASMV